MLAVALVASAQPVSAQPSSTDTSDTLTTSLTLGSRAVTVSTNALTTTDRDLLASSTAASVRVGTLDASSRLRVGTLDGTERPGASRDIHYGLWLTHVDNMWQLEARGMAPDNGDEADGAESSAQDTLETIPLAHTETAAATAVLTAAVIPHDDNTGQIVLAWGRDRWSADFTLATPSAPEPAAANAKGGGGRSGVPSSALLFDADQEATYRGFMLGERHETAATLPGSADLSLTFWRGIGADAPDFDSLSTIRDGDVVKLTMGGVMRLVTDVPLRFGGTTLAMGNYSPDTPGQYGLWLKRVGTGWQLVFNHESDSWGTQYYPEFDVAAVDLAYTSDGPSSRSLGAALTPTGATSGRLTIHWGEHQWTAEFDTAP